MIFCQVVSRPGIPRGFSTKNSCNLSIKGHSVKKNLFFLPNMNTEYYSVFRNHWIPNIEYYSVLRKSEYQILFGIKKIRIPNSTIPSNYSNTEYLIPNSIQHFGENETKTRYLSHTIHFVLKVCETIWTGIWANYSNTRILFGVPKSLNTKYQILFSIEKIRIPNMNNTIRSNYLNSIWIPNYLSHPVKGPPFFTAGHSLFETSSWTPVFHFSAFALTS